MEKSNLAYGCGFNEEAAVQHWQGLHNRWVTYFMSSCWMQALQFVEDFLDDQLAIFGRPAGE